VLQEKRRPHQGTTAKQPKAPIRGSTAVSSLDCLLADMESFKSNKGLNSRGRTVEIEVENKKDEELEKKLDNLTDKLLGALQTGTQTPEDGQEKSDLGKCAACGSSIEESAVLAGGETFHQDCFTCTHCQGRLGERFYVVGGLNYCSDHQTVALDSCSGCNQPIKDASVLVNQKPYHPTCFSCSTCQKPIDGKFFTEPDGRFLCEHDYQQTREKCDHCKLPLLDRVLTAMEKKFHPTCFRCGLCDVALEGVPFLISGGSVNCQPCYTKYKAAQCVRCNKGIVSTGSAKTSLVTCQGKSYHEQCYTCADCSESLSGQFVCAAPNEEIVCFGCDTKRRG